MESNQQPMQNTPPTNTPPVVSDDELKMPEEDLGAAAPAENHSKALLFTLIGILVVLLAVLGAVVLWGDTLVTMLNPQPNEPAMPANDLQPEPAAQTEPTAAEELAEIEEELESTDFEEFEAELESIEAEFESETAASAE